MQLNQLVEAMDAQVVSGDIFGAFEQFAAENVITHSNPDDITRSKAEKRQGLRWFLDNVARTNHIERHAVSFVGDNETHSQFTFDFVNHAGQPLVYNEIIRRVWADGKVVEEQYLLDQTLATGKKAAKKVAEAAADARPATTPAAKKAAAPKKETAKKAAQPAAAKADDLTIVEGIGPKIAELLVAAGIANFSQLATTKPAAIKTILEAAGKRYQMHDPATWPQQAALARDGKTAELAKLQAELKGGK
jgi:large subunit ribosomal protein L17